MRYFKSGKTWQWALWYFIIGLVYELLAVLLVKFAQNGDLQTWGIFLAIALPVIVPFIHATLYSASISWPLSVGLLWAASWLIWQLADPQGNIMQIESLLVYALIAFVSNWAGAGLKALITKFPSRKESSLWKPSRATIVWGIIFLILWPLPAIITFALSKAEIGDGLGLALIMFAAWLVLSFLVPYLDAMLHGANITTWLVAFGLIVLATIKPIYGLSAPYFLWFLPSLVLGLAFGHLAYQRKIARTHQH